MRPTGPRPDPQDTEEQSLTRVVVGHWSLEVAPGELITVSNRALVFGRDPSCDVVLQDRTASQRQAIVLPMGPHLELLTLGRNPTLVNGEPVIGRVSLQPGQRLEMPGLTAQVRRIGALSGTPRRWVARTARGAYGLRQLPLSIGGGASDGLQLLDWPEGALTLRTESGLLVFETRAELTHGGRRVPAGAVEVVSPGDVFVRDGVSLTMGRDRIAAPRGATEGVEASGRPVRVRFEFLARGGRLSVDFGLGDGAQVELPELRARLIAALLCPPKGFAPGEYLPDDLLIPAVWSGSAARTRTDVNVLLHHTRKALVRAGLNPARVLSRAQTGGATCFLLASGALVEVV